jgi:hypothetical protein
MPARAVFIIEDLAQKLRGLPEDHKYSKWIADMKAVLKENIFAGDVIKKGLIPDFYLERYGVNNLYRYQHPEGHRSCYTITEGCAYIIDLMTHPEYDTRFGYRTT